MCRQLQDEVAGDVLACTQDTEAACGLVMSRAMTLELGVMHAAMQPSTLSP